jgi:hypothetical protein
VLAEKDFAVGKVRAWPVLKGTEVEPMPYWRHWIIPPFKNNGVIRQYEIENKDPNLAGDAGGVHGHVGWNDRFRPGRRTAFTRPPNDLPAQP